MNIEAIVFDLGGVLIDWNPRYLYRKLLQNDEEVEYFLANICTAEWNAQQDGGRPFREGVATLKEKYPAYAGLIEAYHQRWEEMLGEAYGETVEILSAVKKLGMPLYALTNWSAETFPIARKRYEFLSWFEGILVSGEVGLKKPDPEIFRLLLKRYKLNADQTIYLDDVEENLIPARQVGLRAIHFQSAAQLRTSLQQLGLTQI
jgi:2-haloacid dehalogenase